MIACLYYVYMYWVHIFLSNITSIHEYMNMFAYNLFNLKKRVVCTHIKYIMFVIYIVQL